MKYAKERHAFGRPIGANQAIQFKIADMETRAHTARLAWRDAASRLVRGRAVQEGGGDREAVLVEVAVDNAREATQIHGGYGFMNEYPVARIGATPRSWRSARAPARSSGC